MWRGGSISTEKVIETLPIPDRDVVRIKGPPAHPNPAFDDRATRSVSAMVGQALSRHEVLKILSIPYGYAPSIESRPDVSLCILNYVPGRSSIQGREMSHLSTIGGVQSVYPSCPKPYSRHFDLRIVPRITSALRPSLVRY
jgi:hypothetical protein